MGKASVKLKRRPRRTAPSKRIFPLAKKLLRPILQESANKRKAVTATWSTDDKPTFKVFIDLDGTVLKWGIEIEAPNAPSAEVSVWRLLNDGTKVRRAFLTPGGMRKTTPGQFTSGPGFGGFIYASSSLSFPGIEKGRWDEIANEEMQDDIQKAINEFIRA